MTRSTGYGLDTIVWRNLLGRASVFYAVRERLAELYEMSVNPAHRVVYRALDDLYDAVQYAAAHSNTDTAAIASLILDYTNKLSELLSHEMISEAEARLLEQLQDLIPKTSSRDPFKRLFKAVVKNAAEIYGDQWRSPELSVAQRIEHPRPMPAPNYDPYSLTASTVIKGVTRVQLSICPHMFGPAAFAVIPLIFVHECVCHVPARQEKNSNRSPFAEGFMDWAAWLFFERWIIRLDPALAPTARLHATELHTILTGRGNPKFAPRRAGYISADVLVAWFHTELGWPSPEANLRVALLALDLNVTDVEIEYKDNFVVRLRDIDHELGEQLAAWGRGLTPASQLLYSATAP